MKPCPYCAEQIPIAATVCSRCHHNIGTWNKPHWWLWPMFVVAVVSILAWSVLTMTAY